MSIQDMCSILTITGVTLWYTVETPNPFSKPLINKIINIIKAIIFIIHVKPMRNHSEYCCPVKTVCDHMILAAHL